MMQMTSAISEAMEEKKRSLQAGLDAFYERMGLGVVRPAHTEPVPGVARDGMKFITHSAPKKSAPGVARKGFRARKGERTEEEEKLPKHLRYR